jgi:hypothetical protein
MGSLDAYKDEIISQLLEGDWKKLFPRNIYANLISWMKRQKEKESVVVRFTFYNTGKGNQEPDRDMRYAVYLLCDPSPKKGKVAVQDLKFSQDESPPLAIPPILYERALYNMPNDLLDKILKKKKKP